MTTTEIATLEEIDTKIRSLKILLGLANHGIEVRETATAPLWVDL